MQISRINIENLLSSISDMQKKLKSTKDELAAVEKLLLMKFKLRFLYLYLDYNNSTKEQFTDVMQALNIFTYIYPLCELTLKLPMKEIIYNVRSLRYIATKSDGTGLTMELCDFDTYSIDLRISLLWNEIEMSDEEFLEYYKNKILGRYDAAQVRKNKESERYKERRKQEYRSNT